MYYTLIEYIRVYWDFSILAQWKLPNSFGSESDHYRGIISLGAINEIATTDILDNHARSTIVEEYHIHFWDLQPQV